MIALPDLNDHDQATFAEYFAAFPGDDVLKEMHSLTQFLASGGQLDIFDYVWQRATVGEKRNALMYLQETRPDVFPKTKADESMIKGDKFSSQEQSVILRYFGKMAKNCSMTIGRILCAQNIEKSLIEERQTEMAGVSL